MKILLTSFVAMFILVSCWGCREREDIQQFAATETYPEDTVLQCIADKKAMIVLAHDDDMCGLAGTASWLNAQGWEIAVLSFRKSPERDAAQVRACRNILDTVMFVPLTPAQIRRDTASGRESYSAFPKDSFPIIFNKQLIREEYLRLITDYKPSVVFTLDNEMGGYGHPEHILVSDLVLELAAEGRITPRYIYQSVYTDHMENSIMERHSRRMKDWGFPGDEWASAKGVYGVSGMPEPTVQINIRREAESKMAYLRSYNERERKTIGFFVPEFEAYDAEEYFTVFDREFFRVIPH
jgi:LmbE family N-acetylglucosaminyl deacetylase